MEKVKWGIIGTSTIAKNIMIPAMSRAKNAEFYAIASRGIEKLGEFSGKCSKLYSSYEDLLKDPDIQAVYIPLPNTIHCEWTVKAAEYGKHILCEKPLAMTYEECKKMADAAEKNHVFLMEGFMTRHSSKTKQVCEIIKSGVLGEIQYIHAINGFDINDPKNVRLRANLGGGALFDMGCYCVNYADMIMELIGAELVNSSAQLIMRTDMDGNEVDVRCNASLLYDSGTICNLVTWFDSQPTATVMIVGRKGKLTIPYAYTDDLLPMTLEHYDFASDPACQGREIMVIDPAYNLQEKIEILPSDRYTFEIENMSESVLTGKPPFFSIRSSLRNMKTIEALYSSVVRINEKDKRKQ